MEQRIEDESRIIKYLLGELLEEERRQVEDTYAVDDEFFEEIQIIESELIDKYVQGELFDKERERFEASFLNSQSRRKRVENARLIMKGLATAQNPKVESAVNNTPRSWLQSLPIFGSYRNLRLAAGIAIVIVAFTTAWIIIRNLQQSSNSPQQSISFELTPNAVRSSNQLRALHINPDVGVIEFHLHLDKSIQGRLSAIIQSSTAKILQTEPQLEPQQTPSGKVVILNVPANIFSSGEYVITLASEDDNGISDIIAEYQFKVIKQR